MWLIMAQLILLIAVGIWAVIVIILWMGAFFDYVKLRAAQFRRRQGNDKG